MCLASSRASSSCRLHNHLTGLLLLVYSGYFDAIGLVSLELVEWLGRRGELIHMMV